MLKRVKVVASSVVTWAAVAAALATLILENPDMYPDGVVRVAIVVAASAGAIGAVVGAIRRVTPVEPDGRGLLPKP